MHRVALAMGHGADVREVLYTAVEREARHTMTDRRDRDALRASLAIDTRLVGNPRKQVVLLDDVLTTGCSFKVCKEMIGEIWPESSIIGVFVARRVPQNPFADTILLRSSDRELIDGNPSPTLLNRQVLATYGSLEFLPPRTSR